MMIILTADVMIAENDLTVLFAENENGDKAAVQISTKLLGVKLKEHDALEITIEVKR